MANPLHYTCAAACGRPRVIAVLQGEEHERRLHGSPREGGKVDPRDRRQLEESPVRPRRVMQLFRPHARPLALVTVLIIVTSIVGLAQLFLIKRVIDDVLPNRDTDLLVWATVGMVAVAAVSGLLSVVQTWLATSIGQRVMHSLLAGPG